MQTKDSANSKPFCDPLNLAKALIAEIDLEELFFN
jgi:hypothetical protein